MSEVATWLKGLGLGEYIKVFAENKIDREVLGELDEQDLKDLDIPLGHRKKLLKAIAALDAEDTPAAIPAPKAERRQLTVMFVDLVGSTALSGQLDPEELRELMLVYQNAVAGEITRFEGYIARYMGDGVLAYFGWPRAHEDEAERAVRAGLAVTAAVARLATPAGEALAARVGIATGLVVVGDLIGEGAAQEEAVVGETPNLAARLQGLAAPSTVAISEVTRRLCGELFELEALGAQHLKGIDHPVEVYGVRGERAVESRYQAHHAGAVLPLIGREHELAQLMERWQQARAGEGQIVLLTGEAGIGKSRLLRALGDALEGQAHYRISYQCSPYHSDSALYPVIRQLARAAGFADGDDDETKLDKLEMLLGRAGDDVRGHTPLIAALLGIDAEARYGRLDLTPQQQRSRTLQALVAQLAELAQSRPVLCVLEDAHWIDPSTLELIERALDVAARSRMLLLITARPTFEHHFGGHPIVTRLVLNRLGREPSLAMIGCLGGGKTLPAELLDEIVRKTDGVPLFVEELTKTVLESRVLRETGEAYVLDSALRGIDIPSSLHDSLMARLDRLRPIREVAQTAACVGREFGYRLLSAVAGLDDEPLQAALGQLVEAELIFRRGVPPEASYMFKHALVRDAAYESLLRSKRQAIHAGIAQTLEARFAGIVATHPELVAYHYTEAQLADQAVRYWERAGQQAVERSANHEAIAYLRQGVSVLQTLADSDERRRRELRLQILLAGPLSTTKGYGAAETVQVFERARALSEQVEDAGFLFPVLYGQFVCRIVWGEYSTARQLAEQFLELAQCQQDTGPIMIAHRILGFSLHCQGKLSRAREHLKRALAFYRPERHADLAFRFGQDQRVAGLAVLSNTLHVLGYADQAARTGEEAIDHARIRNHVNTLGYSLYFGGIVLGHCRRELNRVKRHASALLTLAKEQGLTTWQGFAISQGWLRAQTEHDTAGVLEARRGIDELRAAGTLIYESFSMSLLAEIHAGCGQWEEGLDILDQALSLVTRSDERWYEAELYRLKGVLLLGRAGLDAAVEAENCFQHSLAIARRQGAKSWELRTATSLARLWRDQGKRRQAYELLAPVYGWFTEGFDTVDLKDAKQLLEELS